MYVQDNPPNSFLKHIKSLKTTGLDKKRQLQISIFHFN